MYATSNLVGYDESDLAYFEETYGDYPWLVHLQGTGEVLCFRDATEQTLLLETDALALAAEINALHDRLTTLGIRPCHPPIGAAIFHHGLPYTPEAS